MERERLVWGECWARLTQFVLCISREKRKGRVGNVKVAGMDVSHQPGLRPDCATRAEVMLVGFWS